MSRVTIYLFQSGSEAEVIDCVEHIKKTAGQEVDVQLVSGYGELNEQVANLEEDHFFLINDRVAIHRVDWAEPLLKAMYEHEAIGVMGVKTVDSRGLILSCGRTIISYLGMRDVFSNNGFGESDAPVFAKRSEVDSVLDSLVLIRKKAFVEVGGFDEKFAKLQRSQEVPNNLLMDDFCLSVRELGYGVWVEPEVLISSDIQDTLMVLNQPGLSKEVNERVVNLWRKKWRWHPDFPNLDDVRQYWPTGKLCWRVGEGLRDEWSSDEPMVDLLMVTRNNRSLLKRTLECLAKTDYPHFKLSILFNGAGDDSPEMLWELRKTLPFPVETETTKVNVGLPAAFNWLVASTSAPLVVKLDDDVLMEPDWLKRLVTDLRENPYAGAVGCKIVSDEDDKKLLWADYRLWPKPDNHQQETDTGQFEHLVPTIANMGCCVLYRRKALDKAGPIDIALSPVSWDDLEHQLALRKVGYDVLFDGRVKVQHPWKAQRDFCKRSRSNMLGNGTKVNLKWGPGIFEVIDRGIDLRIGREPEANALSESKGLNVN